MRLYVWTDPYKVSYGGSFLFVVAESVEAAREIAKTAPLYHFGFHDDGGRPGTGVTLGEPARVVDLPAGEWFQWAE